MSEQLNHGPVWYMRDNHTFRALKGGPESMVAQCLEEIDAGYFGVLDPFWQEKMERVRAMFPIRWDCLAPDPLHELLWHSDCDGEIAAENCGPIADSLERLLPLLPDEDAGGHIGNWREKTRQFIDGLRAASRAGEPLDFH